jgi:CRP-like cAMP-binding protein
MGEGVDPTQMCRSLVDKVSRAEQLKAVADPELLVLFEDWLEELEGEVVSFVEEGHSLESADLAEKLGISRAAAAYLLAKLKRDGRL